MDMNDLMKQAQKMQEKMSKLQDQSQNVEVRGEFTIIVAPKETNKENDIDTKTIQKDLEKLIKLGLKRSSASSYLAYKKKISKNVIYNLNK